MARQLDVYWAARLVGLLIQEDDGTMAFTYASEWLDSKDIIALSRSLPLRPERFSGPECKAFFGGILPEAENRRLIAKNLGISARNDFAMLEEIGGECAGALTFVPSSQSLIELSADYHALTDVEMAAILKELPRRPLLAGAPDVRLSLAGAQDKIAVCIKENRRYLPLGGAPSTHIVKPGIDPYEETVVNEAFCMRLASAIGLPAAVAAVSSALEVPYLLIKRYDREVGASGELRRLHQEDFCQALSIVSERKYQSEGGPSLPQCFALLRESSSLPAVDLLTLFDSVVFNYLIGNNDAHGKNFSLLYQASAEGRFSIRLAPLYDLISTAYYPGLSRKMAMKIGSEYDPERVALRHFEQMAEEAGLNKTRVLRLVRELARRLLPAALALQSGHPVEAGITEVIRKRCERVEHWFSPNTSRSDEAANRSETT